MREIRKTSHHDKSKYNKHSLHKNKYENKVVKKSVGNKNIKSKLSVSNLNRGKRRNKQASKRKAHVKINKDNHKHKHPHKVIFIQCSGGTPL